MAAILAFLGAMAALPAPRASAAETGDNRTIIFFGDSITAGLGLDNPDGDSYPGRIRGKLAEAGLPYDVVNAGLSGDTTAGGLRRIDWTLQRRPDIFVLALGANDGLRGVPTATTEANLQGIIDRVRSRYPEARIVLTGMMMPETFGSTYTTAFRELFPRVAERNDVTLVPFLLEGVGGVRELNQGDRIHPNVRGHEIVAENVWKVLEPLLGG